jgi:hypothetical protein
LVRATVFGLVTWSVAGFAADAAGAPKKYRRDRTPDYQVAVHVTFSTRDVHLIRTHYASRYRSLPPGLQKKLRRTGQLPPGWQKKFEPFPPVLERELVVLPRGYSRGVIDGHAVIIDPHTHVIVDLAVLF